MIPVTKYFYEKWRDLILSTLNIKKQLSDKTWLVESEWGDVEISLEYTSISYHFTIKYLDEIPKEGLTRVIGDPNVIYTTKYKIWYNERFYDIVDEYILWTQESLKKAQRQKGTTNVKK